jgi:hypothetical protein
MSGAPMPETSIILSEEDRLELSQVIAENVLEEDPSEAFLTAFIERETDTILDGIKWGFHDTVVREDVASRCSKFLIGREWPRYGDRLTPEQFDQFEVDLKKAYLEWIDKN